MVYHRIMDIHHLALKILGVFLVSYVVADKHEKLTCDNFSDGTQFNYTRALGEWNLLHCWSDVPGNKCGSELHCLSFIPTRSEERKELAEHFGARFQSFDFDNLVMKMKIPCSIKIKNAEYYYLEKQPEEGSFLTLQIPPPSVNVNETLYLRSPIRMKFVKDKYLAMMDCKEHFTFVMGRPTDSTIDLDPDIKKMFDVQDDI